MPAQAKKASKRRHLVRAAIDFSSQIALSDVQGRVVRQPSAASVAKATRTSRAQAIAQESMSPVPVESLASAEQAVAPVAASGFKALLSSVTTRFGKKRTLPTQAVAAENQMHNASDEEIDEIDEVDDMSAFAEANNSQIGQHDLSPHEQAQALLASPTAEVHAVEPTTNITATPVDDTEVADTEILHPYDRLELDEHTVPAMATSDDLASLADSVHAPQLEAADYIVSDQPQHEEEPDTLVSEFNPDEFSNHEEPIIEENAEEESKTNNEPLVSDNTAEIDEDDLFISVDDFADETSLATPHEEEEAVSFEHVSGTGLSAFFRPLSADEMAAAENSIETDDIEEVGAIITWTLPLGMAEAPRDPSARMNLVALAIDLGMYEVVSDAATQDPHPGVRQAAAQAINEELAA